MLSGLIGLLKPPEVDKLSISATLVAVKALTAIAMQRNQHMGRCLPTLLALAHAGGEGENGKAASLKAELKKGLLAVLGSQAPAAQAWTHKVATRPGPICRSIMNACNQDCLHVWAVL